MHITILNNIKTIVPFITLIIYHHSKLLYFNLHGSYSKSEEKDNRQIFLYKLFLYYFAHDSSVYIFFFE